MISYIDAGHGGKDIGKRVSNIQTIVDVDSRFRILDEFGDYVQVITLRPAGRDLRFSTNFLETGASRNHGASGKGMTGFGLACAFCR